MNKKQVLYDRYGVEEYYLYDPDKNDLSGWIRASDRLDVIESMEDWTSPRLGICFNRSEDELQITRPDGKLFTSYVDISRCLELAEQQITQERERADQEQERANQERERAQRLVERLRAAGIDPAQID